MQNKICKKISLKDQKVKRNIKQNARHWKIYVYTLLELAKSNKLEGPI